MADLDDDSEQQEEEPDGDDEEVEDPEEEVEEEEAEEERTIPPELLTRLLHEFFEKDGTRITKDANAALGKYMEVFVREAVARAGAEKDGRFLEVGSFAPLTIRHRDDELTGWLVVG